MGKGGETFVLNMGEQIKIVDLAEDLIRLSGLEPHKDIEIVFTGIREGEKLSEDLWNEGREFKRTAHPEIYSEEGQDALKDGALDDAVEKLVDLSYNGQSNGIIQYLNKIVPQAEIKSMKFEDITEIN
jgi:FlaA1/EpsC-like NDP-sugar epimerase